MVLLAGPATSAEKPLQPIAPAGTTTLYAQTLDWLDDNHFAVGRWDGSISIFRVPTAGEWGPVITQAMALPSGKGVEMLVVVDDTTFVSSNNAESLILWGKSPTGFEVKAQLPYASSHGTATSGIVLHASGASYLITGHESGAIIFWARKPDGGYDLTKTVDVKSPDKPANPWGIHHIRGLAAWNGGSVVITASEDGDLVGVKIPDGTEIFRVRYNQAAQRGINNISLVGDMLLVANCAVGQADKNLWLFDLKSGAPVVSDAENLVVDLFKSQVFNFDADLIPVGNSLRFFSSTEEGLLWAGDVEDGQLVAAGVTKSSPEGGSIIDVSPTGKLMAVVTYAIRLYKIE